MYHFYKDFLEDVAPLVSMQLGGPTLDGIADIFDQYIGMLIMAVPNTGFDEEDTRKVMYIHWNSNITMNI